MDTLFDSRGQNPLFMAMMDVSKIIIYSNFPNFRELLKGFWFFPKLGLLVWKTFRINFNELEAFLNNRARVVLIMGNFRGCRSQELPNLKSLDIVDWASIMVVNIPERKTGAPKKITILDERELSALLLLRRYIIMTLRPASVERFFKVLDKIDVLICQPIKKKHV
ncbi:hypothetical protein NQ317_011704 [Molorchus minor]|uniref:Uncharacterized protein n=1 Tax=Molorchus minor TaxID=1323400 RepID=A0ABQ9JQT2_9CUCU|nr:hypothetical protein NQ317_011704 [Molorchus minor]